MLRKIRKFIRNLKRPKCKYGYNCAICEHGHRCYADNNPLAYCCRINAR